MLRFAGTCVAAVLLTLSPKVMAAPPASAPASEPAATAPATKPDKGLTPSDKLSVTPHTLALPTGPLYYTATAGYMPLKDESGKLRANFFFVAYTKEDKKPAAASQKAEGDEHAPAPDRSGRPVTFIFNGGPGAASVWLHLGAAGPQRVALAEDGTPLPPPARLVDNQATWLDATDLVFIDPVGTGYSRAANPEQAKEFYNVQEDIHSVGEFVRLYLTRYQRWGSAKFLAGESYGTTRASLLAEYLQGSAGVALNGVILISSVLNFQNLSPSDANDVPFTLYLPTYTAAAFYHKKLPADLQADLGRTLEQSRAFAIGPYTTALAKGDKLDAQERGQIIDTLARLTGLSRDYLDRSNLRIEPSRFQKELLRDQRKIIGRYDARISAPSEDAVGDGPEFDPSFSGYNGVYESAFNQYIRGSLNYENDLPYEVLKGIPFSFGEGGHGYLYVGDNLRSAMVKNPHLKLLVAAGYYDLATPWFSADYTIAHLALPPPTRANVTQTYYPGGHMLYHVKANLEKLHDDVKSFVEKSR